MPRRILSWFFSAEERLDALVEVSSNVEEEEENGKWPRCKAWKEVLKGGVVV